MFKYISLGIFILIIYLFFAEIYPIFKNTKTCVDTFSENYVRLGLLDNKPNGDSGKSFCKSQKRKIINLEECLNQSREKETIKGLTDLFFKIRRLFSTNINSVSFEKEQYNNTCEAYPRLQFK